eukprot:9257856-Ditylum_brightwellii.AAC.1
MQLQQPAQLLQVHKADTRENVQINYRSVFDPHKTLGHYKALAWTGRVQATVLTEHDEKYNRNMAYAIQDGPSHLGGCEFTPLMQSDTKKLLQIALTWANHQS